MFLKARLHRRFHLLHPAHNVLDFLAGLVVEQGAAGTRACGVACRADLGKFAVRNQSQDHRVLDVNVTAKGTGQSDAVHLLNPHAVHQQPNACVERGLRQLNRPDVVLRDADGLRPLVQNVGEGTSVLDHAGGLFP